MLQWEQGRAADAVATAVCLWLISIYVASDGRDWRCQVSILLGHANGVATIDKVAPMAKLPRRHGVWIAIGHQELLLNAGLAAQPAHVLWLRQI